MWLRDTHPRTANQLLPVELIVLNAQQNEEMAGRRVRLKTPFHWFPAATPMCWGEEQRAGAAPSEAPPGRAHHRCSPKAHRSLSDSRTAGGTACTGVLQFRGLSPWPFPLSSLGRWSWPVWLFAAAGTSCKLSGSLLLPLPLLSCTKCCWWAHTTPGEKHAHYVILTWTACNLPYKEKNNYK